MTISVSPGCSWSPSTQSQTGSFNCMITASMNSSGCIATLTNESFQADCDENNKCSFNEINNIQQSLPCDGSTWTVTTAIGPEKVASSGSCTCQQGDAAANPSASTSESSSQVAPSSASSSSSSAASSHSSASSNLVRTSTALLMLYVAAASIVGNF
ncbi:hypothetical protein INT44_006588 [Umbelopsis vinacea]|uniref:Uncharacterized protein n=1 Tax=Umbelopsis vinacea TaxID=44442 RepID=A0A8H7PTS4_9FUNG|nr:hypothetical protein INT44_006588 [Umbelopsis vinacea]